jgi:hypothetical protein
MSSLKITAKTSVSPQEFVASLTNFGPERAQIWTNSQPDYFMAHDSGPGWAEVTEGSGFFGGVWEKLHYDWSSPNRIILKTLDSNMWSDKSGWQYTLEPTVDGSATIVHYTITRFAKTKMAHIILIIFNIAGKSILTKDFRKTLRAIEAKQQALK